MQEQTLEDIREGTLALQLLQTGLGRPFQQKVCKNQSSSDEEQTVNREKNANEFEGSKTHSKRRIASHQGTQITYISMVSEAIRALGGQATCPQIASYMEKHFSSLLANRKVKQWRNSVSGCLSTYCIRHGRDAQGRVVWKLNEDSESQPARKTSPVHKQEKVDSSSHDEEEFDDEAEEEEPEEEEEYQQSEEDEDFVNSRPRKLKRSRSDAPSTPEKKPTQPQSPKPTTTTQPQSSADNAQHNYNLWQQKLENVISSSEPLKKRLKGCTGSGSDTPQSPRSPISPLSPSPHSPSSPSFQAQPASPTKTMDEKSFQDFLVNKLQSMQDQISKMTDEITSLRTEVQTLKSTRPSAPTGMIPISAFLS